MKGCKTALPVLCFIATILLSSVCATQISWTLKGSSAATSSSTYPGARYGATTWVDSKGTMWMFSGVGKEDSATEGYLNQFYNYDLATNTWTQVSGTNALNAAGTYPAAHGAAGTPGGRYGAASWTDAAGNLYLFGGMGVAEEANWEGLMNDLWKFTPATKTWTFLSGHSVVSMPQTTRIAPSPRAGACSWVQNGNLYLFGGKGFSGATTSVAYLNDLWSFNTAKGQWTIVDAESVPSVRAFSTCWVDANGQGWIFGGSSSARDYLNDMWQFNGASFSRKSGSPIPNQKAVFPSYLGGAGQPGGLYSASSWSNNGELFLFGGYASDNKAEGPSRNIWKFAPATNTWTYVYGTHESQVGSKTAPGGRYGSALFADRSGNVVVFGGSGLDIDGSHTSKILGDTWALFVAHGSGYEAKSLRAVQATANTTTTTSTTGSTSGGVIAVTTATVAMTLAMEGDPTKVNTATIENSIASSLGLDPLYVNVTILTNKREVQAAFRLLVTVFYPNNAAINAATAKNASASGNLDLQLQVLKDTVIGTVSNSTVKNAIAAQGLAVTGVTADVDDNTVIVTTTTAAATTASTTSTTRKNSASSLSFSYLLFASLAVSAALGVFMS